MEAIGGALVSALVDNILKKIDSKKLKELFKNRKIKEAHVKRLKTTLLLVTVLINEAENVQHADLFVQDWINELKDAAWHAEDLLDELYALALQEKGEPESSARFKEVCKAREKDFVSKFESVILRLEELVQLKDTFMLALKESLGAKAYARLPTTSLINESGVFGRDIDRENLKRFLVSDQTCENGGMIHLVAILGMAGIGKTTLAQVLYNDLEVQEQFKHRAWFYVSQEFDVLTICKTMLESMEFIPCNFSDLNQKQFRLKRRLRNRRILLVLDDVWSENLSYWDFLQYVFSDAHSGSRIIVTSRHWGVASSLNAVFCYRLRELSYQDCYSVFANLAYGGEINGDDVDFKLVAKAIVEKCNGLPLAAKALGKLACSKMDVQEWDSILRGRIWDFPVDKVDLLASLALSYCHLPPNLKSCFAYCSIFPQGYVFEKRWLIMLWMAEGLLQQHSKSERGAEETGLRYFDELASRSFFQPSVDSPSMFKMHDLLIELAQFVSGEFSFKIQCGQKPISMEGISEKTRYCSLIRENQDASPFEARLLCTPSVRTFLAVDMLKTGASVDPSLCFEDDWWEEHRCLRVLSLSQMNIILLSDRIDILIHLHHLDLSFNGIVKLPESVCRLYWRVSYCQGVKSWWSCLNIYVN